MTPAIPTLEEIRKAHSLLKPYVIRSPLVRLHAPETPGEVFLKLENLQPTGSFKVRCMGYALMAAAEDALIRGTYTASSGNSGIGLAWMARQLGIVVRTG